MLTSSQHPRHVRLRKQRQSQHPSFDRPTNLPTRLLGYPLFYRPTYLEVRYSEVSHHESCSVPAHHHGEVASASVVRGERAVPPDV